MRRRLSPVHRSSSAQEKIRPLCVSAREDGRPSCLSTNRRGGLAGERAGGTHTLAVEPQEDGEGNAEQDGKAGEERVAAAEPERIEHLAAEEREGEAKHRAEDLCGIMESATSD